MMNAELSCAFALIAMLLAGPSVQAGEDSPRPADKLPRPYPEHLQWWAEGRFGMFIHWGPVSLKGTEISWSRANTNPKCPNNGPIPADVYDNLYKEFNPTRFDATQWTDIAKAASVTEPGLLHHFPSKAHLLMEVSWWILWPLWRIGLSTPMAGKSALLVGD